MCSFRFKVAGKRCWRKGHGSAEHRRKKHSFCRSAVACIGVYVFRLSRDVSCQWAVQDVFLAWYADTWYHITIAFDRLHQDSVSLNLMTRSDPCQAFSLLLATDKGRHTYNRTFSCRRYQSTTFTPSLTSSCGHSRNKPFCASRLDAGVPTHIPHTGQRDFCEVRSGRFSSRSAPLHPSAVSTRRELAKMLLSSPRVPRTIPSFAFDVCSLHPYEVLGHFAERAA